jgi:hypothetical protein
MEVSVLFVVLVGALAFFFYLLGALLFYAVLRAFLDVTLSNKFLCIFLSIFWFFVLIYGLANGNIHLTRK